MRGFSPIINILLTCVAAAALAPVLAMPWFGAAFDSNDGNQGSIELMGEAISRWFTESGTTTTGTETIGTLATAIVAVAGLTAVLALLMLVPAARASIRGLVKLLPLAAPVLVVVAILAEAGSAATEPRYGAFVALALTVFLASAAQQAGEMREKKTAAKPYSPGAHAR